MKQNTNSPKKQTGPIIMKKNAKLTHIKPRLEPKPLEVCYKIGLIPTKCPSCRSISSVKWHKGKCNQHTYELHYSSTMCTLMNADSTSMYRTAARQQNTNEWLYTGSV